MNSTVKTVVFWLVIVLSAFLLWQVVKAGGAGQKEKDVNFSQFMTDVDQGNVKDVTINLQEVHGHFQNDGSSFHTTVPTNVGSSRVDLQACKLEYSIVSPK